MPSLIFAFPKTGALLLLVFLKNFRPKQVPCRFSLSLPLFGLGPSSKGLGTNLKLPTNKIAWIHWSLDLGHSSKVALRRETKIWYEIGQHYGSTIWSKICGHWDLQEKEKLFMKMQISSVVAIFFIGKLSAKFRLKSMVSFIVWPFFIKIFRKFWENVLFECTLNYFTHFGGNVC